MTNRAEDKIRDKILRSAIEKKTIFQCSKKFTWEYYDKAKVYHSVGSIKPIDFYNILEDKPVQLEPLSSYSTAITQEKLDTCRESLVNFSNTSNTESELIFQYTWANSTLLVLNMKMVLI
uniref:Uncharacterized protein n=1 Tax=Glossina brevipalpis TaxID=37001 RepID=A0A1A9VZN5_9MUSC